MDAGENPAAAAKFLDIKDRKILLLFLLIFIIVHFLFLNLTLSRKADFLFNDAQHRLGPGTDFSAYYNAGQGWLAGRGIYGHGPGFGFRYHPLTAAALYAPLSQFSETTAYGIWVFLLEVAYFSLLFFLYKIFGYAKEFFISSALLLCFSPYYLEIFMGNSTFLAAALLVWGFYFYRQERMTIFTLVMIASILIKPIGLVFMPILLVRRQFKPLLIILGTIAALALPFFLANGQDFTLFTQINFQPIPAPGWIVHGGNQGFHSLVADLCTRLSGLSTQTLASFKALSMFCRILLFSIPFLLAGIALWLSWVFRAKIDVMIFLWCTVYILGYKDVWEHTYTLMLIGLIFLAGSRLISKKILLAVSIWLALPTLFILYDKTLPAGPVDPEHYWNLPISILHHCQKPAAVIFLSVAVILSLYKQRSKLHD